MKEKWLKGANDKAEALREFCSEKQILLESASYVGNDINDQDAMQFAGTGLAHFDLA